MRRPTPTAGSLSSQTRRAIPSSFGNPRAPTAFRRSGNRPAFLGAQSAAHSSRQLVRSGYAGWVRPPERAGRFVVPASVCVRLVLKVEDSALRPPEFVHGVQSSYLVIDGGCAPQYVEVTLSPLEAYRLLGLPMNQLSGQLVDLREVIGGGARRLGELVRELPTWAGRFDAIDRFLLGRAETAPVVAPEIAFAWQRLITSGGTVSISGISKEVGWSHKHVISRFTQQVGLTPKRAARIIRFERALSRLTDEPAPDWCRLAADLGYSDQAHLIRDFAEFVGMSPAAFLAAHAPVR